MAKRGRKTNKKEAPKAKDPKGYLDSNKDAFTDYKVIKGNKITMQGVSGQVYAIPVDSKGNAGEGKLMKPGENHKFEGASHVIEVPEVAMAQLGLNTGDVNPKYQGFGKGVLDFIQNTGNSIGNDVEGNMAENSNYINRAINYGSNLMNGTPNNTPNTNNPNASNEWTGGSNTFDDGSRNTQPTEEDPMDFVNSTLPFDQTNGIDPSSNIYNEGLNGVPTQPQGNFQPSAPDLLASYEEDANAVDMQDDINDANADTTFLTNQMNKAQKVNTDFTNRKNWVEDPDQVNVSEEDEEIEDTQKIQFDNPYGGVDIPTAAQTLGASFSYDGDKKGANTARGVASGLKLLTGLGRNVMSGYGQNKRNQFVTDKENEKQRKANQGQTEILQQGGNITDRDLVSINDTTGLDFTQGGANSLFEHMPNETQGETTPIDFGKYEDVGYFSTGEMQNGKRVIHNTSQNPMNYVDNKRNALEYLRELNGDNFDFQYRNNTQESADNEVVSRKKGGKVTAAELLTGSVTTGDSNAPHNVEVEKGEHIKDNQSGQVQEVMGKKHSKGGEKMNLEDHKVLSDFTKIGSNKAKKYRDEFDIKVKSKDSYATVMDKILKKTGYKSITDELTNTIEKTEKEQKSAKDRDSEATTGINMQHLSGKINDLTNDLKPLEEMKANVFETLFEDQQGSKSKSDIESELTEMKDGGEKGDGNDMSREKFKNWIADLRQNGYEGDIDVEAEDIGAEAGKAQEWMIKNKPEVVLKYFRENGQSITAKGMDMLKNNNPGIFQKAGIDGNKAAASYSEEEKETIRSAMKEEGLYTDEFILEQFNDNKFEYRAPLMGMQLPQASGRTGDTKELMKRPYSGGTGEVPTVDGDKAKREATGDRTALLPSQHTLPPSTMQPHRLGEITPRESEAKLISPTAQIEELNRQAMTARESINTLPDSQRRAALAQLNAQTQQSINQVMSQTNRANAQIEGQNEQANIQRGTKADLYNEQAANLHERNQLLAKDNTETDIRNYFNAQNKKQVANYNTINNMNLTNAMYDNFQYDGNGKLIQTGKAPDLKGLAEYYIGIGYSKTEADKKVLEDEKKSKNKKAPVAKRGRKTK